MLKCIIENAKGNQLEFNDETKYQLYEVDGLYPPNASISSSNNVGDGSIITNARVPSRNIVLYIAINGNVEVNRLNLYQYAQVGKYMKMYFSNNSKNVWIEGRVETIETSMFSNKQVCQISTICPEPFFKDLQETINRIDTVDNRFYFPFYTVKPIPFSVYETIQILNLINDGNIKCGMEIDIYARGTIVNPIVYNRETQEYIGFGCEERPFTMLNGDRIIITTQTNNKKVKLIRNAQETNIFNSLKPNSTFLQLDSGDNTFTYSADDGNEFIDIKFKHYSQYEGI